MGMNVRWIDAGREPRCQPNPAYPDGVDLDITSGTTPACETALPYPAKRVGTYLVECPVCGQRVGLTTAGRPDDPRSLKMACRIGTQSVPIPHDVTKENDKG